MTDALYNKKKEKKLYISNVQIKEKIPKIMENRLPVYEKTEQLYVKIYISDSIQGYFNYSYLTYFHKIFTKIISPAATQWGVLIINCIKAVYNEYLKIKSHKPFFNILGSLKFIIFFL